MCACTPRIFLRCELYCYKLNFCDSFYFGRLDLFLFLFLRGKTRGLDIFYLVGREYNNFYKLVWCFLVMVVQVRERTIEEIEGKLAGMNTALNKIGYLESALKEVGFSFEIKRFLWTKLAGFYEERKMFDRAAKAMANKAGVEVMFKEKIDSFISAAELYARVGTVDDADDMFLRAIRDVY